MTTENITDNRITCVHVINGSAKINKVDETYGNPNIAVCKECQNAIDNIETNDVDIDKLFVVIE